MAATESAESLSADESARLTDFARACKAAARVVVLYPASHPAIQSALARIAESAAALRHHGGTTLTILPHDVRLGGRGAAKPDGALQELAGLLHAHLIGEMTLEGELTAAAWHAFLTLVARAPEELRAAGGIARIWAETGGGPIGVRQIDYAEVLRERTGDEPGRWDALVARCLAGDWTDLDEDTLAAVLTHASDAERFHALIEQLAATAARTGRDPAAVAGLLQALADYTARTHPDRLDATLTTIAGAVSQLSPDHVMSLMGQGDNSPRGSIDLGGEVRARVSDADAAAFVARSLSPDWSATSRLVEAFQVLVTDADRREAVVGLAEDGAAQLPIGRQPEFENLWKTAADLLTSYSDERFVPAAYGRELAAARAQAVEVERVGGDPPERIESWLSSVSDQEMRRLDQQVLADLLAIEPRPDVWPKVLESAIGAIEQQVAGGDVALAQLLLDAIAACGRNGSPFAALAIDGLQRLRSGPPLNHLLAAAVAAPDDEVPAVAVFCRTLGPSVIPALAQAFAADAGASARRLREIVLAYGADAGPFAAELRRSTHAAVRRTAVEVLRSFGGADAIADLAALLDDEEPGVQREAVRALVQLGTDEAYGTLRQALQSGQPATRDAILRALGMARDERAIPVFTSLLAPGARRGADEALYLQAIEALGWLGGDEASVSALSTVLYRGDWWAPRRTARRRAAAAAALRACGTPAAHRTLEAAAHGGPRGTRRAARTALGATPESVSRRTT